MNICIIANLVVLLRNVFLQLQTAKFKCTFIAPFRFMCQHANTIEVSHPQNVIIKVRFFLKLKCKYIQLADACMHKRQKETCLAVVKYLKCSLYKNEHMHKFDLKQYMGTTCPIIRDSAVIRSVLNIFSVFPFQVIVVEEQFSRQRQATQVQGFADQISGLKHYTF